MCLGPLMVEDWADAGWGYRLVDVLLIEVTGFLVIRNLDRLWRAPADDAGAAGVDSLVLVAALFMAVSKGPVLEGDGWSTKPLGVALALVGAALLTLGLRDVFRLRTLRSQGYPERAAEPLGVRVTDRR